MTAEHFGRAQQREARALLTKMRASARQRNVEGWLEAHSAYHQVFDSAAPAPLRRQMQSLADRSVRYIRIAQYAEPSHWAESGDLEHPAILEAVSKGHTRLAMKALAEHLAGTALRVLAGSAPGFRPQAVPRALAMVVGSESAPAAVDAS
jgi:DNA-binding GntR family transcriptional regulator